MQNDFFTFRKIAYLLIDNGFRVFPVHSVRGDGSCTCGNKNCDKNKGKHPIFKQNWQEIATLDKNKVDSWWHADADFCPNIAIATGKLSNLTVIDVDKRDGGLETWANLVQEYDLKPTFTVKSGSGGYHYYYKYNELVKTATDSLAAGIDTRNDGGYIIAPPSIHKSLNKYEFLSDELSSIFQLADFPIELLEHKKIKEKAINTLNKANNSNKKSEKAGLSLAQVEKMLESIDSNNYDTWLKVGIILGRVYNRNDDAWSLYRKWSDTFDGNKSDPTRIKKMQEAFFELSQDNANSGHNLTINSLVKLAYQSGYKDNTKMDIGYFCYIAEQNAFIYLLTGAKWVKASIDAMCDKVQDDGSLVDPSTWIIKNRAASAVTTNANLPCGYIKGYEVAGGVVYKLENASIVNLFSKSLVKPLPLFSKNSLNAVKIKDYTNF